MTKKTVKTPKKTNRYVVYYFLAANARKGPDTVPLKVTKVNAPSKLAAFNKASTPARVLYEIETESAAKRRKKPLKELPLKTYGAYLPLPLPETLEREQADLEQEARDAKIRQLIIDWFPYDYKVMYATTEGRVILSPETTAQPDTPAEPAEAKVEPVSPAEPAAETPVEPPAETPAEPTSTPAEPSSPDTFVGNVTEIDPDEDFNEGDYGDDDYEDEPDEDEELDSDDYDPPPPEYVDEIAHVDLHEDDSDVVVLSDGLSMNQLAVVFLAILGAVFFTLVGYTVGFNHGRAAIVHAIHKG